MNRFDLGTSWYIPKRARAVKMGEERMWRAAEDILEQCLAGVIATHLFMNIVTNEIARTGKIIKFQKFLKINGKIYDDSMGIGGGA